MELFFSKYGQGPALVILHGFLGTSDNWFSLGKQFSEHFTVYLIDLRNHGRSPHSEQFNYDLMANDLKELLDREQIENPFIIGHSMGGKVVMNYSKLFPDQFEKLIIVDISPRFYPVHHETIMEGLLSIDLSQLGSRNDAETQLANYVKDPGVRQFLLKNLDRSKGGFSWKANLKVLNEQIEEVGKEIYSENVTEKSVLFLAGDHSDYIKTSDRSQIKSMYPNSKILTIKNAGHWLHAEQPEVFYKSVNYFLSN